MRTPRFWILVAGVVVTAWLAYIARDAVHDFVVAPIAYGVWQLSALLGGVAQLVQWAALVVAVMLIMFWQLIPRLRPRGRLITPPPGRDGSVNSTAVAVMRARSSNYFRWQLAHRLGRVARHLGGGGRRAQGQSMPAGIADYLDSGLNRSFVDYASPRLLFARPRVGPLDLDPEEVVHHLEDRMRAEGGMYVEHR